MRVDTARRIPPFTVLGEGLNLSGQIFHERLGIIIAMKTVGSVLDGQVVAQRVLANCADRVQMIIDDVGVVPCLATVLVGEDPASVAYVQMKQRRCESIGMKSRKVALAESITTDALVKVINKLGADQTVHGILLQHPVPPHIDERAGFEAIPTAKDVDGVTFHSFASTALGPAANRGYGSCTPAGIMRLLQEYDVSIEGKHAVVVGRSPILGKPMAMMLLAANATVTICHSKTVNLPRLVREGDIVVAAVGRPQFVQGDWIKPGAVVIDAGYNPGNIGDVDYDGAAGQAAMITPVPGGVGPMTIATLLENTTVATVRQTGATING